MAEAEADQRVPLRYDGEGLPVFEDWEETPATDTPSMEDRVRVYREELERGTPVGTEEVSALIAEADTAATERPESRKPDAPVAPVRRHGSQPAKLLGNPVTPEVPEPPPPKKTRRKLKVGASGSSAKYARDKAARQIEDISDEDLLREAGIVPFYSTTEASQFFDRTTQWMYWGLGRDDGPPIFIYPDGTPIEPERIGDPSEGRRRFTLPVIKDILLSSYRRGNIEPEELKKILRRIRINELGGEWREREGWVKIRGKWVHPDQAEQVNGTWVRKKTEAK